MKRLLITGNPTTGLAQCLHKLWPEASFVSRDNGWDLTNDQRRKDLAKLALQYDVFINNSALWQFNQSLLLKEVYSLARSENHRLHIVCVGSTTDRSAKGTDWTYHHEKKALRDFCNSLGMMSTWGGGPRVGLVSLGSLSNVQHKHPNRICMDIDQAAGYIKWMVDQPSHLAINELSIDPIQDAAHVK